MPFSNAKHQIAFVSQQTLPIFLGVIMAKPQHVHLLVTEKMANVAKSLTTILQKHVRKIHIYPIPNAKHQNIVATLNKAHQACNKEGASFNVTGGTKLMAIAAWEWAFVHNIPAFYVDTENEELVFLEQEWKYQPLPAVLGIHELLYGHGYEMKSFTDKPISMAKRIAIQKILELICRSPKILSHLNNFASQAKKTGMLAVNNQPIETSEWHELVTLCESLGMLQQTHDQVIFASEEARHWCNGIWFEEYVASILYKLKQEKSIQSWAMSVEVYKNDVLNELDAVFTAHNRLFTIECKTANMQKTYEPKRVTSVIYKVDSLRSKLGGIYTQGMICSVLPLNNTDKKRAQEAGIKVICGKEVLVLEAHIKSWIADKHTQR